MKRLILLVLVCALGIPMFSMASAGKQLYGEIHRVGPAYDQLFYGQEAGYNFSGIRACIEFYIYTRGSVNQNDTFIRTNVLWATNEYIPGSSLGYAEFRNNLAAEAGLYFPAAGQYLRTVGSNSFSIQNGRYYTTSLSTNVPSSIEGWYHGWITDTSSGD